MAFFATNSLVARFALRDGQIDAVSFTVIRIFAGAAILSLLVLFRGGTVRELRTNGSAAASLALFGYAILFSFAYVSLSAGTGALVLFAAVQITMLGAGMARGERPRHSEWIGLSLAFAGLVYLVSPGLTAPSPIGTALMSLAGAGWGLYSMAARGFRSPIAATAGNFVRATPLAAATTMALWMSGRGHASWQGTALSATSGAFTSGLGYIIWYTALKDLRTSRAAIVQLTVPLLAATAGVLFMGEKLSVRLVVASAAILGGVAWALVGKSRA